MEEPAASFAVLEADYFSALDVTDPAIRKKLPAFAHRMDRMAEQLVGQLARQEITDPMERREAGRALFYAGFVPHVGHHGLEDGFNTDAELLVPPRYTDGTSPQAELTARLQASAALLAQAAMLRPDDTRIATVQRSVRFNLAALQGPVPTPLLDEMLAAAETDFFSLFAALVLWRDPTLHPLSAGHMTALFHLICSPARFDCARMGPPPTSPTPRPPTLTQLVVGPTMVSDLLVKRAEDLAAQAEAQAPTQPAAAKALLGEAKGLLSGARGTANFAHVQALLPTLSHFRFPDALAERVSRIDALTATLTARLAGTPQPLPDATSYYRSNAYRAIYQCVACHTQNPDRPGLPQSL